MPASLTDRSLAPLVLPPDVALVRVTPWHDDGGGPDGAPPAGVDPRSAYAERFWLPFLGPTALLLHRRLVAGFDDAAAGYPLDVGACAVSLGLSARRSPHGPFGRSLARLGRFSLARYADAELSVRLRLPPLHPALLRRLPTHLLAEHRAMERRAHLDRRDRPGPAP